MATPQQMSTTTTPTPSRVLIEGSVVLTIIKQSRECQPVAAYGKTIGHVVDDTLTITRSFPVSSEQDFSPTKDDQPSFFEGSPCGLFSSCPLDESHDALSELCTVMALHQRANPAAVLILYNPALTQRGMFSLRVVRVTQKYLDLEQHGRFTAEKCAAIGLNPTEMFEDVHFFIHNSHLVFAYIFELTQDPALSHLMVTHREVLDPSPTAVSNQLLDRLLDRGSNANTASLSTTTHSPHPLFDQYAFALERFHRETGSLQRQRVDHDKRVNDIREENRRRAGARLPPLNIPEQPAFADPSLQDIQLFSVRINNVAADLSTMTELAHQKQSLLKKLITTEGHYVIE